MELNDFQLERGRRKLAEYDLRRDVAYKNQVIALRDEVKRITGMGVRDFRAYLVKVDQQGESQ